ncbi:MAG: TIGR03905 family TSCPD domain-containing protein [Candidatus Metalachnospira sp.]|nr:TIGR03905 family TSCPD domain-containing protein [Candidatus Metalachnospira sp.]
MRYKYETKGTCSKLIEFTVEDGILKDVKYTGGCNGNLQGISELVEGMRVEDVIDKLKGLSCGMKSTSCPDQLARALSVVIEKQKNS